MKPRRALVLIFVGLTLTCASGPAPTRKQYIAEADAICATYKIKRANYVAGHPLGTGSISQIVATTKHVNAIIRDEVNKLRGLRRPKGDKARLEKIFNLWSSAIDDGDASVAELPRLGNDQSTIERFFTLFKLEGEQSTDALVAYGIEGCSTNLP